MRFPTAPTCDPCKQLLANGRLCQRRCCSAADPASHVALPCSYVATLGQQTLATTGAISSLPWLAAAVVGVFAGVGADR
jgi:hypothetical protein